MTIINGINSTLAERYVITTWERLSSNESQGVAVLQKCVNPLCSAQFRFLHEGKLFEVEIQYLDGAGANGHRELGKSKVHVERYWLCDQHAEHFTLRFDRRKGLLMHTAVGWEEVAIPLSSGRTVAEISQVRIRPLDLNVAVRRDFTGGSKVRRQAA